MVRFAEHAKAALQCFSEQMASLADTATATLDATHQISELELELKNSDALCASLNSELDSLKQQLRDANAFNAANLKRHAEWKAIWKKERDAVSKRENEVERMKERLVEERKELEKCKTEQVFGSALVKSSVCRDPQQDAERAHKTEKSTQEVTRLSFSIRVLYENAFSKSSLFQLHRQTSGEKNIMTYERSTKSSTRKMSN